MTPPYEHEYRFKLFLRVEGTIRASSSFRCETAMRERIEDGRDAFEAGLVGHVSAYHAWCDVDIPRRTKPGATPADAPVFPPAMDVMP